MEVQVMHRTVTDFLDKPEIWEELQARLKEPLQDANSALCYSSLFMFKHIFTPEVYGSWASCSPTFKELAQECVHYAARAETASKQPQTAFFDSLFDTASSQYYRALGIPAMRFPASATTWVHTLLPRAAQQKPETMFLALAIELGAVRYVAAKLSAAEQKIRQDDLQFLLDYTLRAAVKRPGVVKLLLSYGADPNDTSFGDSPWHYLLKHAWNTLGRQPGHEAVMTESAQIVIEMIETMMNFDVDPNQICTIPQQIYGTPGREESVLALSIFIRMRNPKLVRLLVAKSADPNRVHNSSQAQTQTQTPWQEALSCLYLCNLDLIFVERPTLTRFISDWLDIYETLLRNGSDPCTTVVIKRGILVKKVSVLTVIRDVFSKLDEGGSRRLSTLVPVDVKIEHQSGVWVGKSNKSHLWSRLQGVFRNRELR